MGLRRSYRRWKWRRNFKKQFGQSIGRATVVEENLNGLRIEGNLTPEAAELIRSSYGRFDASLLTPKFEPPSMSVGTMDVSEIMRGPGLKKLIWERSPDEIELQRMIWRESSLNGAAMSIELSWLVEYMTANTVSWSVHVNPNSVNGGMSRREYVDSYDLQTELVVDEDEDYLHSNDLYQIIFYPLIEADQYRIVFGTDFKDVLEKAKEYLDKEEGNGD